MYYKRVRYVFIMKTIILGTLLGLTTTVLGQTGNIGGSFKKVSTHRCGAGLRLKNEAGILMPQALKDTAGTHDFYGLGEIKYTDDWNTLVETYPGISTACLKFDNVFKDIDADLLAPPSRKNQYISHPHSWKNQIVRKLHDAGCAVSKNDDTYEQYIESLNYPYQQKLRMQKAKVEADQYELKIQALQDEWKDQRARLVNEMGVHGDAMLKRLQESEQQAGVGQYNAATDTVLGEHSESAVNELDKVSDTLQLRGESFEALAHYLKRDSLRWSKLNQISNEQGRLKILANIVKLNAFDLLVTCLVNFQLEAALGV